MRPGTNADFGWRAALVPAVDGDFRAAGPRTEIAPYFLRKGCLRRDAGREGRRTLLWCSCDRNWLSRNCGCSRGRGRSELSVCIYQRVRLLSSPALVIDVVHGDALLLPSGIEMFALGQRCAPGIS